MAILAPRTQCRVTRFTFLRCSRPRGHVGPHIALRSAVWWYWSTDEDAARRDDEIHARNLRTLYLGKFKQETGTAAE